MKYLLTLSTTNNEETIIINEAQKKLIEYLTYDTDFMAEDFCEPEIVKFDMYKDLSE